jgi:DNA-binding XRE family transcriptional regulator
MSSESIACRLRTLQSRSGLSQRELAEILGFACEVPVSRHAHSVTVPNLLTALGYEVIFRERVSDLFPGLYQTVEAVIEERLAKLENELQQSTAKGRPAAVIARKLEFLCERKDVESSQAAV